MAELSGLSAQASAKNFSHKRRTIVMIVVALAFVMELMDATIVNIAIPSIQRDLGTSYSAIQWLVSGYLLAFGTLLITGGRLGDIYGYKKLFMLGVGGFTVASLLSGLAPNAGVLIAARLLQGAMAAVMVPQVLAMMQVLYQPHERAAISGIFGMLGGLSATVGPIIGGLLIEGNILNLDWRPIFLINIPIGIFALFAGYYLLPSGASTHPPKNLDYRGTALVVLALGLLIFALVEGRGYGWPWWIFVLLGAGVVILAGFVRYELSRFKRDFATLLVPALFKQRSFSAGLAVMFFFAMAFLGFFFTFSLALQIGLGFSALKAALIGIPIAVGIALSTALFSQKLLPKLGSRLMSFGAELIATGILLVTLALDRYEVMVQWWQLLPGLFIFGLGMGMLFGSIFAVLYNDVEPRFAGAASGLQNGVQEVAGAIGIALIGVVFFGQITSNSLASLQTVTPNIKQQLSAAHVPRSARQQIIAGAKTCFSDRASQSDPTKTPPSCHQPNGRSPAQQQKASRIIAANAQKANQQNFTHAFKIATIYELGLLAAAFALSFLLPSHLKHPEATGEML